MHKYNQEYQQYILMLRIYKHNINNLSWLRKYCLIITNNN